MQVGHVDHRPQVGEPVSRAGKDFSNVETQNRHEDCFGSNDCKETFKLTGEYDLEKICEGTFESPELRQRLGFVQQRQQQQLQ